MKKVPYMLVVGEKEVQSNTVSLRQHKKGDLGTLALEKFISQIHEQVEKKSITV
jgi:threonyl-tRNA synthetase